jgi:hypothetical protein
MDTGPEATRVAGSYGGYECCFAAELRVRRTEHELRFEYSLFTDPFAG